MTRNEKLLATAKMALYKIARLECSLEDAPGLARRALAEMAMTNSKASTADTKESGR